MYNQTYDVVVAGGGPSGVAAAIAAARNHANVLLIERYGFFGGMLTNASLPVFCPFSDGIRAIIKGIGLEILEKYKIEAWMNPYVEENNGIHNLDWVAVDQEILKRTLDNLVIGSGCKAMLHTNIINTHRKDDYIDYITVYNKEGIHDIKAKVFIDCTGDADLIAQAGGAYEYGDEKGLVQAVTLCFKICNVDGEKFLRYKRETGETGNLSIAVEKARQNGDFPFEEASVASFALQNMDVAGLNFGHVYEINPLKAEDLTQAEIESRNMIPGLLDFLKKYVPGLENSILASTGPFIGIRESRRIIGEYRLTKEDYLKRETFEDQIARYAYPIDIHAASPREIVYQENENEFITLKYKPGESYGIPFRALVPKEILNVLAAGRTLSADRAMHGSFRVTPACFATGEAAGTAAAICCHDDVNTRSIDIKKLQLKLLSQGAYF